MKRELGICNGEQTEMFKGLFNGSTTVIVGQPGAGKSTMCLQFLRAAEQKGFYINFEKPPSETKGVLELYRRRGNLDVNCLLTEIRYVVLKHRIKRIAIDGLSSLLATCSEEEYAQLIERILSTIDQLAFEIRKSEGKPSHTITLFITFEPDNPTGTNTNVPRLSALADNLLIVRPITIQDEVRHAVRIAKARHSNHDRTIRELRVGTANTASAEAEITPGLESYRGLLSGRPRLIKPSLQLFHENKAQRKYNNKLKAHLKHVFNFNNLTVFGFSRDSISRSLIDLSLPETRFPSSHVRVLALDEWAVHDLVVDDNKGRNLLHLEPFDREVDNNPLQTRLNDFWVWEIYKGLDQSEKAIALPLYLDFGMLCLNVEIAQKIKGLNTHSDWDGYDLRLMSVDTTDDLLTVGELLVIVALMNGGVHIRIFDADGQKVVDKPEGDFDSGPNLTYLKKLLNENPFPAASELSQNEKKEIIEKATLVSGHTHWDRGWWQKTLLKLPRYWVEIENEWFKSEQGKDSMVHLMLQAKDKGFGGFCFDLSTVETATVMFLEFCWGFGATEEVFDYGYDLRLMSVDTTDDLPTVGELLVIVALVNGGVHIRIFDADGQKVVDKPESDFDHGPNLTYLKKLLNENPFPDASKLLRNEKKEIIEKATLVSGHTHLDYNYKNNLKAVQWALKFVMYLATEELLASDLSVTGSRRTLFSRHFYSTFSDCVRPDPKTSKESDGIPLMIVPFFPLGHADCAETLTTDCEDRRNKLASFSVKNVSSRNNQARNQNEEHLCYRSERFTHIETEEKGQISLQVNTQKEEKEKALRYDHRDCIEFLRRHNLRRSFLDKKIPSEVFDSTPGRGFPTGYCCTGSWMVGVHEHTHSAGLSCKLIDEMTSSASVCKRAELGAGLPARKDFYDYRGSEPVTDAPYLTWSELLTYCGARSRQRQRAVPRQKENGYDLRLMSVDTTDDLPTVGELLVIVALVNGGVHIRIFDADGQKVVDKPGGDFDSGPNLTYLKEVLNENPFPDAPELSRNEIKEIIEKATLVSGHTQENGKGETVRRMNRVVHSVLVDAISFARQIKNEGELAACAEELTKQLFNELGS